MKSSQSRLTCLVWSVTTVAEDLDHDMVEDVHGPKFEFWQMFTEPADVSFGGTARQRTYTHGMNREYTRCLSCPHALLDDIKTVLSMNAQTKPSDYYVASTLEVELEAQALARRRQVQYRPGATDLSYLLTAREAEAKEYLDYLI